MAAGMGIRQRVLLQVNISGEASKSGVAPEQARELCRSMLAKPSLQLEGLMSIGQYYACDQAEESRRAEFRAMAQLHRELEQELGAVLPELSMGMSDNFELAVEEGATLLRVGSAIFGSRQN